MKIILLIWTLVLTQNVNAQLCEDIFKSDLAAISPSLNNIKKLTPAHISSYRNKTTGHIVTVIYDVERNKARPWIERLRIEVSPTKDDVPDEFKKSPYGPSVINAVEEAFVNIAYDAKIVALDAYDSHFYPDIAPVRQKYGLFDILYKLENRDRVPKLNNDKNKIKTDIDTIRNAMQLTPGENRLLITLIPVGMVIDRLPISDTLRTVLGAAYGAFVVYKIYRHFTRTTDALTTARLNATTTIIDNALSTDDKHVVLLLPDYLQVPMRSAFAGNSDYQEILDRSKSAGIK